jgi:hypothetical protein
VRKGILILSMGRIKIHAVGSSSILSRVTFIIQLDFVVKSGGRVFRADDIANGHSSLNRSFVSVREKETESKLCKLAAEHSISDSNHMKNDKDDLPSKSVPSSAMATLLKPKLGAGTTKAWETLAERTNKAEMNFMFSED